MSEPLEATVPAGPLDERSIAYVVNCIPWERDDLRRAVGAALRAAHPVPAVEPFASVTTMHDLDVLLVSRVPLLRDALIAEAVEHGRRAERREIEQAFIDGSVEGSPVDRDGNRKPVPAVDEDRERLRETAQALIDHLDRKGVHAPGPTGCIVYDHFDALRVALSTGGDRG